MFAHKAPPVQRRGWDACGGNASAGTAATTRPAAARRTNISRTYRRSARSRLLVGYSIYKYIPGLPAAGGGARRPTY